jgi:hypothetical protein
VLVGYLVLLGLCAGVGVVLLAIPSAAERELGRAARLAAEAAREERMGVEEAQAGARGAFERFLGVRQVSEILSLVWDAGRVGTIVGEFYGEAAPGGRVSFVALDVSYGAPVADGDGRRVGVTVAMLQEEGGAPTAPFLVWLVEEDGVWKVDWESFAIGYHQLPVWFAAQRRESIWRLEAEVQRTRSVELESRYGEEFEFLRLQLRSGMTYGIGLSKDGAANEELLALATWSRPTRVVLDLGWAEAGDQGEDLVAVVGLERVGWYGEE